MYGKIADGGYVQWTLFHYDVMGEKVGTKWRKTCTFYT